MTTQWIVARNGVLVNLSKSAEVYVEKGVKEGSFAVYTSHHMLAQGSESFCRAYLDQLANRIGAVDSRKWAVPA